jgi:hypothetical protein
MLSDLECFAYVWAGTKLHGAKVDLVFTEEGDGIYLIDGDIGVRMPLKDIKCAHAEDGIAGVNKLIKIYVGVLRNTIKLEN